MPVTNYFSVMTSVYCPFISGVARFSAQKSDAFSLDLILPTRPNYSSVLNEPHDRLRLELGGAGAGAGRNLRAPSVATPMPFISVHGRCTTFGISLLSSTDDIFSFALSVVIIVSLSSLHARIRIFLQLTRDLSPVFQSLASTDCGLGRRTPTDSKAVGLTAAKFLKWGVLGLFHGVPGISVTQAGVWMQWRT